MPLHTSAGAALGGLNSRSLASYSTFLDNSVAAIPKGHSAHGENELKEFRRNLAGRRLNALCASFVMYKFVHERTLA